VETGEIFGFLGPNGAGKSTTVRMLTTLLSITAGTARVGVDMTSAWVLGQRALREAWRTPEALPPTLFIPLFFLADRAEDA